MARFLEISTVLDNDLIVLTAISGKERLDHHSEYRLSLASKLPDITEDQILGTNVTVGIELVDGGRRHVNGYVTGFSEDGETASSYFNEGGTGKAYLYTLTLHSWTWLLGKTTNCRIFQEMNVVAILKKLLEKYAFAVLDTSKLTGSYRIWDYCCQYRETDENFLFRMCQIEGISFFFRHENGTHTMVLADSPGAYLPASGYEKIEFAAGKGFVHTGSDAFIGAWHGRHEIATGKIALTDFNPKTPTIDLAARGVNPGPYRFGDFEKFDYPGDYPTQGEGTVYANIRQEEERALESVFSGPSTARGIAAGNRFTLAKHPKAACNQAYIIIGMDFDARNPAPGSGDGEASFACTPMAIPAATTYRPKRRTGKPRVRGPLTAFVVGPPGEEIYTDNLGRVKVQFHFDREGPGDDKSSCWLRVGQTWAGKKRGAAQVPRIGHEVAVGFFEGNPDSPFVVGCLYNGVNVAPYDYPAEKTRSGMRSKTYKGTGFNEFTFEDKTNKESIYLHAERDHELRIKNDRQEHIGGQRSLAVDKSEHEAIKGENLAEVKKDRIIKIGAEDHLDIAGDQNNKFGGTYSLKVGEEWHMKSGASMGADAAANIHFKAGTNVVIEAGATLTLKSNGNFVHIGAAGVHVSGAEINVNSGGSAGSGDGASPDAPRAPGSAKGKNKTGVGLEYRKKPEKPASFGEQATTLKIAGDKASPLLGNCACAAARVPAKSDAPPEAAAGAAAEPAATPPARHAPGLGEVFDKLGELASGAGRLAGVAGQFGIGGLGHAAQLLGGLNGLGGLAKAVSEGAPPTTLGGLAATASQFVGVAGQLGVGGLGHAGQLLGGVANLTNTFDELPEVVPDSATAIGTGEGIAESTDDASTPESRRAYLMASSAGLDDTGAVAPLPIKHATEDVLKLGDQDLEQYTPEGKFKALIDERNHLIVDVAAKNGQSLAPTNDNAAQLRLFNADGHPVQSSENSGLAIPPAFRSAPSFDAYPAYPTDIMYRGMSVAQFNASQLNKGGFETYGRVGFMTPNVEYILGLEAGTQNMDLDFSVKVKYVLSGEGMQEIRDNAYAENKGALDAYPESLGPKPKKLNLANEFILKEESVTGVFREKGRDGLAIILADEGKPAINLSVGKNVTGQIKDNIVSYEVVGSTSPEVKVGTSGQGESFAEYVKHNEPVRLAGQINAAGRIGGRALAGVGAYMDGQSLLAQYAISQDTGEYGNTVGEATRIAGGWTGAYVVGEAFGAFGAGFGFALGGPPGAAIGGVLGGLVGGGVGYYGGSYAAPRVMTDVKSGLDIIVH